jgi:heme-degrading monooxygenase HmoA
LRIFQDYNYKLLSSGKEDFNPLPDWSVYGLLQIWDTETAAQEFFNSSKLIKKYQKKSSEQWTIYMKCVTAKGEWSGRNPFRKSSALDDKNPLILVITRPTIKQRMLFKFWKYVPISQQPLVGNKGLNYTKGVGEVPFLQMATFSIWRDKTSLMDFAYNSGEHQKAIQITRQLDWYKEELFSRFQPYRSIGNWNGINPLPELKK